MSDDHTEKAKRIDSVENSLDGEGELLRRLPEINAIYCEDVRDATIRMFLDGVPEYFWERPSSSTGKYHSPDERGKHGNWIHTKRVFVAYTNISDSYVEGGELTDYHRECGKAAALLHDTLKYGWPSDGNDHTVNDHDIIAANVAEHISEAPDEVVSLIDSHMGPWGEGPLPETTNEWVFHTADKSASGIEEDDRAIYYPSDELLEEWPELITIDHDPEDPV